MNKFIAYIKQWFHCLLRFHRPFKEILIVDSYILEEKIACSDCGYCAYYYENYP